MAVSIDISARTGGAEKDLQQFSKVLTGLSKLWENAMGGRGSRQASGNIQQLSKGMEAFGKSANQANQRLTAINQTLEQTVKTRMKLVDSGGKVARKDRDQYESLLQQEKLLASQQRSWQNIAQIRSRMAANAGLLPGAPGQQGQPGAAPNLLSRFGSPLQQFAGTVGHGLLPGIIGVGAGVAVGGMVVHAIREAMEAQKENADFIPRMRPGTLAGTNAFGLNRRMRGVGTPFGFNTRESMGVFQSMSEGGSNFGHGLERDARSAMQFGRMFGIDAGGEASQLATAQRTGAFKAGDAKRFAGMLATEISRTGLGPRAQEVQEATLMLLNQQLHTLGTANPGPIMALQTAFNKSGIAGLTGMAGANTISRLQDAVTNPGSEASEALNFSVFRRMGAKSLYDVKYLQEEGLNNPKYLQTLFRTVEQSAPNGAAADLALKEHTNGALSLHLLQAIRARNGGRLSGFAGNMSEIEKSLGTGGKFLEKGAAGAMELPGNQLRRVEAGFHDIMMKFGEPATQKLISIAGSTEKGAHTLADILTSDKGILEKVGQLRDHFIAPALDPLKSPGAKAADVAAQRRQGEVWAREHPTVGSRFRASHWSLLPQTDTANHADEVGGARWHKDYVVDAAGNVIRPRRGAAGSRGNHTPVLPPVGSGMPHSATKGSFETYDAGGGSMSATGGHHLVITIREGGLVSDASKAALKRYIHECVREGHQETVRSMPNSRNRRG